MVNWSWPVNQRQQNRMTCHTYRVLALFKSVYFIERVVFYVLKMVVVVFGDVEVTKSIRTF